MVRGIEGPRRRPPRPIRLRRRNVAAHRNSVGFIATDMFTIYINGRFMSFEYLQWRRNGQYLEILFEILITIRVWNRPPATTRGWQGLHRRGRSRFSWKVIRGERITKSQDQRGPRQLRKQLTRFHWHHLILLWASERYEPWLSQGRRL